MTPSLIKNVKKIHAEQRRQHTEIKSSIVRLEKKLDAGMTVTKKKLF